MTKTEAGKDEVEEAIGIFTKTWTINEIESIFNVSKASITGVLSPSFAAFNSVSYMGLRVQPEASGSCQLALSLVIKSDDPLNLMVKMMVECTRFSYELKDEHPWTAVPGRPNCWENVCRLDANEFLVENCVTIKLEMLHFISTDERKHSKKKKAEARLQENVNRYLNMFHRGDRTDFSVIVDNKEIKCHRCVLSTTTSIFEVEGDNLTPSSLTLKGPTYDCIYEFIQFLYSMDEKRLNLDKYDKQFLSLAETYKVSLLKAAAETHLIKQLTPATARSYAWLARTYNANRLRRLAEDMVS